jgi:hypothetical protein
LPLLAAVALFWTQLASLLGPQGQVGPPGAPGPHGAGVPAGGSSGQTLRKRSAADHDSEWATTPAADPLFIQGSPPSAQQLAGASRYQWWDTSGGALTLYIEDGVN